MSASPAIVEKGRHKVTKTWEAWTCRVCGARQEARTEVSHYDVEPEAYAWTATAAGETLASSTWSGLMSKGLGQTVSFSVTGTRSACASCTYTASTNALVDVHELSVSRDDYLGINRTDAGRADPVVKTATALIDPAPTGSAAYSWTDRGICSFTGRTDQATARYFAPDPDRASASLLAEPLTVEATVSKGGQTASATCTTNFTVVKVGVVANGVGEAKEETEGAFIPYVADAANGQWTEEGTNALVAVSITCEPELPASESVSITAPEGALYARFNGAYYAMPRDFDFPVRSLDDVEFFLHGHDESSTMTDKVVTVTHQPSGAKDVAKYTSVKLRATNIKFNHDTSSSDHDAINIRRCYADPAGKINVSNGEWLEVGGVVTNEPFCYTTNRAVTVKARFEASNFITSAVVRAACSGASGSLAGLLPTNVVFSGGVSPYVEFAMERNTLACIDRSDGGVLTWSADSINGQSGCTMNKSGPHLVYTILGEPKPPWKNTYDNQENAWTNALEFAIVKAGAQGKNTDRDALAAITTYLHSGHGLVYDTVSGAPRYWNPTNGLFSATVYITAANSAGVTNLVNCYDQAHGVVTLGNLLGLSVNATPRVTMPFGYINTTDLVGVGACNNPFFDTTNEVEYIDNVTANGIVSYSYCMPPANRVCGADDKTRSSFSNHMYATLDNEGTNYVFDACAGPIIGNLNRDAYLNMTIDHSTTEEKLLGFYTTLRVTRIDQGLPVSFPIK